MIVLALSLLIMNQTERKLEPSVMSVAYTHLKQFILCNSIRSDVQQNPSIQ